MLNGNTKPFYRFIKQQTYTSNTIDELLNVDGNPSSDKEQVANILNEYFKSVFNKETGTMPTISDEYVKSIIVTPEGIGKLIRNLKNDE